MTSEEAKNILQLCRPDCPEDLEDPTIAEALKLLEADSELRAWFEEQQAFDRTFSAQLNASEVPAELKSTILASVHFQKSKGDTPVAPSAGPTTSTWWRNPWIGIAAVFAVLFTFSLIPRGNDPTQEVASTLTNPAPNNADILSFIVDEISKIQMSSFDLVDEDPETLKTYLASNRYPTPNISGKKTADSKSIGCMTFNHDGVKISIICFKGERVYHLLTADRNGFPMDVGAEPQYFEIRDQAIKLWTEGEKVQILTIQGSKQDIPKLI
jgi:hypothetical protein